MLDERWGDDEAELATGLRALLEKECPPAVVRAAEAAPDGRHAALEARLDAFGLWDLPDEPGLLSAAACELGRALAPVPFVELAPAKVVLGLDGVAVASSSGVPASAVSAVQADGRGRLRLVAPLGAPSRTTAGDLLVGTGPPGSEVVADASNAERVSSLHRLLDAARLVGAAEGLLTLGVAYAGRRVQFGRPVGAFQAVAHRLADAAIAVDGAGLLVRKAAWVGDDLFATMARAKAVDAALLVATSVHQVMGGYGFAMEEDCQLFSRRIRSWATRLGPTGPALADLARLLLDPAQRDDVRWLWHHERGLPLPRWVRDLD